MDTFNFIDIRYPIKQLIIEIMTTFNIVKTSLLVNNKAVAAGAIKNEITNIPPTESNDDTATKEVSNIKE